MLKPQALKLNPVFYRNKMKIALLEFYVLENKIAVLLVRKDWPEPKQFLVDIGEEELRAVQQEFLEKVKSYNPSRYSAGQRKSIYEMWLAKFYELAEALLSPCMPWVQDCDLLYFVPHKELHYLPLHMSKINGDYLIKQFQVCWLPVSGLLEHCRHNNPARQGDYRVNAPLLMANWKQDDPLRNNVKDCHLSEMETLKTQFQCDAYAGLSATKQAFFENLSSADIIHLACHGYYFESEDTMSTTGIMLNDGETFATDINSVEHLKAFASHFVSANELLQYRTKRCHLVTLSACSSGRSENQSGDELLGLSRALFYAGAPSLLLAQWPTPVNSKALFMQQFYAHWQDSPKKGKVWAFQQATLALLDHPDFCIPFHWGCYNLTGDWL